MKAVLEGLLFVSGNEGLNIKQLIEIIDISEQEILNLINELKEDYQSDSRGITIEYFGNNYKLTTKSIHKDYYQKLAELTNIRNLSQSALETLAIIAYNEPVTRMQVDELRGVSSSQVIRNLIAKDLVKELGKSDALGRPNLYGVTDQFLDYFGLSSKDELPKIEEIKQDQDVELYSLKYEETETL